MDDIIQEAIDDRWQAKEIPIFLELLNDFYTKTNFHDFLRINMLATNVMITEPLQAKTMLLTGIDFLPE